MHTLLLMRHAKSSWKDASLDDEDRPLNGRGKRDAKRMGEFLRERRLVPDLVLTSPAKRAHQTAKRVRRAGESKAEIEECAELYFSGSDAYLARISQVPDSAGVLLVVGHNPDLEALVQKIAGASVAMPTAAIAHFDMKDGSWNAIARSAELRLRALYRPKNLSASN